MWNYRLIRDDSGYSRVHEVFYTKKGKIWGYSNPIDLGGMKKRDILGDLEYIISDIRKYRVLEESEIKKNLATPKWMNDKKSIK